MAPLPRRSRRPRKEQPAHHVAVCDDDLPYIRYVERVLGSSGIAITPITTLSAEEAARVIEASGCDAALLDLHMYNDDEAGIKLIEILRSQPATRNMRLYLATGDNRAARMHSDFLTSNECGLLPKPFEPERLLSALGAQIGAGRAA